jgi:hypothetical protein
LIPALSSREHFCFVREEEETSLRVTVLGDCGVASLLRTVLACVATTHVVADWIWHRLRLPFESQSLVSALLGLLLFFYWWYCAPLIWLLRTLAFTVFIVGTIRYTHENHSL